VLTFSGMGAAVASSASFFFSASSAMAANIFQVVFASNQIKLAHRGVFRGFPSLQLFRKII
jgi:hypothetical protein